MYCEETDPNKYGINDISLDELGSLASLLHGNSDPELEQLRAVVSREVVANNKLFSSVRREIKLCPHCGGSEKRRAGNMNGMHNMDIDNCEKCAGEGRWVEITSVRTVALTAIKKIEFAR